MEKPHACDSIPEGLDARRAVLHRLIDRIQDAELVGNLITLVRFVQGPGRRRRRAPEPRESASTRSGS